MPPRAAAAALLFIVFVVAAAGAHAADTTGVRVFVLKYKSVEEATFFVRPLMSDAGTIVLQPKVNAITVTDRPSVLNTIARALAQFDVPPRGFSIAIKMVRASTGVSAGNLSREIGGIGNKLREVFHFNDYSLVDSAVLHGAEGHSLNYLLGGEYRVSFRVDPMGQGRILRFSDFTLARENTDSRGRRVDIPLFRTTVNMALNQTLVLGASREEGSKKALILILLAQENPRPRPEKGVAGVSSAQVHP